MSIQACPKRLSVTQTRGRKVGDKLVCLTAYTSSVARLVDHEVDLLLVGDSLAMTVYGFESTLPIGLDTMIAHSALVDLDRFARDSPLEGNGFEPSVPRCLATPNSVGAFMRRWTMTP
jgi:hypothetical protein